MSKDEAYIKKRDLTGGELEALERATISHHCRIEVLRFASFMEDVLKLNDYKGGWQTCTIRYLQARLVEELGEYFRLIARDIDSRDISDKVLERKELIDIANFCMMLWDRPE